MSIIVKLLQVILVLLKYQLSNPGGADCFDFDLQPESFDTWEFDGGGPEYGMSGSLGSACSPPFYNKYVPPIYSSKIRSEYVKRSGAAVFAFSSENVTRNVGPFNQFKARNDLKFCFGTKSITSGMLPKHYRCDSATQTCVCNDQEPVAEFRNASSSPTGCSSSPSSVGDPCDYQFATEIEAEFFGELYRDKIRDRRTSRYGIASFHVEYEKFKAKYLSEELFWNRRKLCLPEGVGNIRTMQCAADNKCECLNQGPGFKFRYDRTSASCVPEPGAVCSIEFTYKQTYKHQEINCGVGLTCEVTKTFKHKNEGQENSNGNEPVPGFLLKTCKGSHQMSSEGATIASNLKHFILFSISISFSRAKYLK